MLERVKKGLYCVLMAGIFLALSLGEANSQSHGIPTGVMGMFEAGQFIPESENGYRLKAGGYYSLSDRFYLLDGDTVTPKSYKDYERIGFLMSLDKRLCSDFLIGITLPWSRSDVYREKSYYPYKDYSLNGISEIEIRGGWTPVQSETFSLFTEVRVEIPTQDERDAYTDPHIYLGNDGHWAFGGRISGSYQPLPSITLHASLSYLARLSRDRDVIADDRALALSNGTMDEIEACVNPRDYGILLFGGTYGFGNAGLSLGYELFYETKDNVSDIESGGDPAVAQGVRNTMGGSGYVHSVLAGLKYRFKESLVSLIYKAPFKGKYAYKENIWSLMVGKEF